MMMKWKQRRTPECPRCGQDEDATHVWLCKNEAATKAWEKSIQALQEWMIKQRTLPELAEIIV